jgi:hypothetical protein
VGDPTLGCPVQEAPNLAVSPGAVGQPMVDVTLVHGGEGASPGLEPSQKFQRDADPDETVGDEDTGDVKRYESGQTVEKPHISDGQKQQAEKMRQSYVDAPRPCCPGLTTR